MNATVMLMHGKGFMLAIAGVDCGPYEYEAAITALAKATGLAMPVARTVVSLASVVGMVTFPVEVGKTK